MNGPEGVSGIGGVDSRETSQTTPAILKGKNTPIRPKTLGGIATYTILTTRNRVDSLAVNAFAYGTALNQVLFRGAGLPLLLGFGGLAILSLILTIGAHLIANNEGLQIIAEFQARSLTPEQ